MKPADLLAAWSMTRRGPKTWLAMWSEGIDLQVTARACAATLAKPLTHDQVIKNLVGDGEFEMAMLLLQDGDVLDGLNADTIGTLEKMIEHARAAAVEEVRGRLAHLAESAARYDISLEANSITAATERRQRSGTDLLKEAERLIGEAEARKVQALKQKLNAVERGDVTDVAFDDWRTGVAHAIDLGALDAAEAAIDTGPSSDQPLLLDVPVPPVWPYRNEPIAEVVDWMFGEGMVPPGFERYRPDASDEVAWSLLSAVRSFLCRVDSSVLTSLTDILECVLLSVEETEEGALGYVAELSAPGFHAFGRRRWPNGIPLWLPYSRQAAPPVLDSASMIVEVAAWGHYPTAPGVLRLDLHDVLSVLRDRVKRRVRLLAQLGRQFPLDRAFDTVLADESARWERIDLPEKLVAGDHPRLLVGAPGMGKSTLLLELANTQDSAAVVSAISEGELPEVDVILVDDADRLDNDSLRNFLREIHWVRTTRSPAPAVLVAARPDKLPAFERIAAGMFDVYELPARSLVALREQARSMLGWIGIEAEVPGSYDRLAFFAGGNPTVLFLLCRALTQVLSGQVATRRRFGPDHVGEAWQDPAFRHDVRRLLWEPLQAINGAVDTLRVIVEFCDPGSTLESNDIVWAINETLGKQEQSWIDDRLTLLAQYGFIKRSEGGVGLVLGGPGLLVRAWLDDDASHSP